ncbi:gluconate 2-dehydrogenase gamma chain [Ketogulonicigenium robustum]|uniref:Gluconate 2-dehydrogenase gamma chain n=1 Tax=Ketogulonicigenium robustum TaxID=92947 RepID=A0A1W6P1A3_9RHOB|nr:gluconate 2-dehydrogenase subunit 3 family protein [Ketogulonicigenium robustum]ARO15298.1 gluconate 2-dehydrogenase gamma chain [Ketogulonicigenium robustum]
MSGKGDNPDGKKALQMQTSRRGLLRGFSALPVAAVAGGGIAAAPAAAQEDTPYTPVFFSADEITFLTAAVDRLIPSDDVGPGAVELGVVEFLDRHMQTSYAQGGIWYMMGPFQDDVEPEFGYQGRLNIRDMLRAGIKDTDDWCVSNHGQKFADLSHEDQEAVLTGLEKREITLENVPVRYFWQHLRDETRYGYFADPIHGGNKNMGSWKMIGYPGMRADYTDWVEKRDTPYPFGPVDLMGKRG